MAYNYDNVAIFYDRLSRLIFGRKLMDAQLYLVKQIPAGSSILIIGGGTGWVLEAITAQHSTGLNITYVDASDSMIGLARKRNAGENKVTFLTAPIEIAILAGNFDVVFASFFFDNFREHDMNMIFTAIDRKLRPGGIWLYCDFHNTGILWQKILLRFMYAFFRVFCNVKATHLPDTEGAFLNKDYQIVGEGAFMNGFIISRIYKKPGAVAI